MIWSLVATLVNLGLGVIYLSASIATNKSRGFRVWYFFCGVTFVVLTGVWLWDLLQGFCGS